MKYVVMSTKSGSMEIEAETEEEARALAEDLESEGSFFMNLDDFDAAWKDIGSRAQHKLKEFAKHPTDRNQAYATGYVTALYDNSLIRYDTYSYMLALIGQLPTTAEIAEVIKEK